MTGMPRSGTTLVDKLLSVHPDIMVLSQPLPLLFVDVKRTFLSLIKQESSAPDYPINDMFGVNYYLPDKLTQFLRANHINNEYYRQSLEKMIKFSGQYTKPNVPPSALTTFKEKTLYDFAVGYIRSLTENRRCSIIGSKETFCEEFVPYYLYCGARVILVIRDPRDVISSLNYGKSAYYSGKAKPILFNIRQWRKSVAYALTFEGKQNVLVLRYEDIVSNTREIMGKIEDFVEVDYFPMEALNKNIISQSGELWLSNSSHSPRARINTNSIGKYKQCLSMTDRRFIEACCFYEMMSLGYSVEIDLCEIPGILNNYEESSPLLRDSLKYYVWSNDRRNEEIKRMKHIETPQFEAQEFIFKKSFEKLHKIVCD